MTANRQVLLKSRPSGEPTVENFEIVVHAKKYNHSFEKEITNDNHKYMEELILAVCLICETEIGDKNYMIIHLRGH